MQHILCLFVVIRDHGDVIGEHEYTNVVIFNFNTQVSAFKRKYDLFNDQVEQCRRVASPLFHSFFIFDGFLLFLIDYICSFILIVNLS